jgi:2-dehydro-3-deoxyglucarate aldolase/4-hydroxy-2-oxoheptanedioate aldolase
VNENGVKHALSRGGFAFGAMLFEFSTPGIARIIAAAGADLVIFDQEHTGWEIGTLKPLLSSAMTSGVIPIVRVPAAEAHLIAAALDAGAAGVMVPMVENGTQAQAIVEAAKYPPAGRRGFGLLYADQYGTTAQDTVAYMNARNRQQILIAMIETSAGLERANEIASVEEIDLLWVGQRDLTNSLGIPGEFQNPRYIDALKTIQRAADDAGKAVGMTVSNEADAKQVVELGIRCICYGDLWVYENALRDLLHSLKTSVGRDEAT